jgi:hypothetical protein
MLLHEAFHSATCVTLRMVEDEKHQRIGTALMELMEKREEAFRRAPWRPLPIHLVGAEMERPKERGPLPVGRAGDFALLPRAQPAALDRGCIGPARCIGTQDCNAWRVPQFLDRCNDLCPPLFFLGRQNELE